MKKTASFLLLSIVLAWGFSGCGSSGGSTGGGSGADTSEEALAGIPNADPTAMDYSLASSSPALKTKGSSKAQAGGPPGAEQVGCLVDALYATPLQAVRT